MLAHLLRIAAAEADASAPGETFALPAIDITATKRGLSCR
jgi:hypothetical protein